MSTKFEMEEDGAFCLEHEGSSFAFKIEGDKKPGGDVLWLETTDPLDPLELVTFEADKEATDRLIEGLVALRRRIWGEE